MLTFIQIFGIFNFAMLQPLAELTLANLNSILCPAIADPFAGFDYRLHALWHQLPQAIFGAKIYGLIALLTNSCLSIINTNGNNNIRDFRIKSD